MCAVFGPIAYLWSTILYPSGTEPPSLTNITADNMVSSIVTGSSLTVNLNPGTNVSIGSVTVTMGGVDVTAAAYSNGKISIPSVTGDVVISATGIAADYTQVEYLESPASETHGGIATNYILAATNLVECTFEGGANWAFPFGTCTNGGDIYCLTNH